MAAHFSIGILAHFSISIYITKNTTMVIPAHSIPAFKPSKVFLEAVKEGNKKG